MLFVTITNMYPYICKPFNGIYIRLELCNTIDTTSYRNAKVDIDTQNFDIEVSNM